MEHKKLNQKRIYLIHGWGGRPDRDFFPWLRRELEFRGFQVEVPLMPDTDYPLIERWVLFLKSIIHSPDENTVLVGHSLGCQAILRFLVDIPVTTTIGKVVLIAGFIETVTNLTNEEKIIAKPWLETPIDFEKVRRTTKKIVAFFSDNDPRIPLENEKVMREKIGAEIIIEHDKKHYNADNGILEVPSILDEIVKS